MPFGLGGFPGLQSALGGNVNDMGDMFAQKQEDAQSEPWKIKTETDGQGEPKTTITAPHKDVLKLMDMLKYTEQAIQSMSQRDAQLQQREEAIRKHPLMNVLSQVAGNLAVSDKRLPPIVAALGRSSLALNPTPDQIGQERLGLQQQMGQAGLQAAQFGMGQLREDRLERRMQEEAEQKKVQDQAKVFKEFGSAAQKGELSNPVVVSRSLQDSGMPKPRADAMATALVGISKERSKQIEDARTAATEKDKRDIESREKISTARIGAMLAAVAQRASGKDDKSVTARADKSYALSTKELDTMGKPISDRIQRLTTLQDTINQQTPQADALIAPELLTVMAGGQGSGLRMNEAEIARIVGGRTNWESLKAAVNKWQTNPEKGLSVTPAQRDQIKRLVSTVATKLANKQNALTEAHTKLIDTDDPLEHRKIVNEARKVLTDVSGGDGGESATRRKDPNGAWWVYKDGAWKKE